MPDNKNTEEARVSTSDLEVHGDPDIWECVCKASSEVQGWMKSTKRMETDTGFLYQVSTEHRVNGKVVACAEALCFVMDQEKLLRVTNKLQLDIIKEIEERL